MPTLKQRREKKGLTQKGLANFLGVDQSAVSLWEKGKTSPRVEVAISLARLYDCTLDDIYETKQALDESASIN